MSVATPSLIGARVRRSEDRRYLLGLARYVDDLRLPGLCHATFVRSPHAHALIGTVETGPARRSPGVIDILAAADLEGWVRPFRAKLNIPGFRATDYPLLASGRARFVGEPLAVVVADSRYRAEDAAELVEVAYEPLPPVTNADAARRADAPLLHPELADNVLVQATLAGGDVEAALAGAPVRLRRTFKTNRHTGVPIETRGCVAEYEAGTGTLTLWTSSQVPHIVRTALADALSFPEHRIRVVAPDVGGGFGVKSLVYPEEIAVAAVAIRLGRPVKWIEDRIEHLRASLHAREHRYEVEIGADRDGTIVALEATIAVDVGAYSPYPFTAGIEPLMAAGILPGPYRIRHYGCRTEGVATNKAPMGPYRGVARPAAAFALERMVDLLAGQLGIDPADLRARNLVQPSEFPYTSVTGLTYDSGSYVESVARARTALDYDRLRREQRAGREHGRYLGIGFATYTEQTALNSETFARRGNDVTLGYDSAHVRIEPSGGVTVSVGVPSQGQGVETTMAQVVADRLGVRCEDVGVGYGDTATAPYGMGAFASRGAVVAGGACIRAADTLRAKALAIAAHLLEASADDLDTADGRIAVRGAPERAVSWAEVARLAYHRVDRLPPGMEPGLEAVARYDPPPGTFSNATHAAVVEVDVETGAIDIQRYVVVEDCGTMINPMVVEGQTHGAVAQGIGGAIYEELIYDEDGQLTTASLVDYLLPTPVEVPTVEIEHLITPSPHTPGGMKGVGEGGTIAAPAAIANAVADALSEFGIEVNALPLTPDAVRRLCASARAVGSDREAFQ